MSGAWSGGAVVIATVWILRSSLTSQRDYLQRYQRVGRVSLF